MERYYYPTPDTIRNAFDAADVLASAGGTLNYDIAPGIVSQGINLSTIATILIQDTGRFAEQYASDFLIDWNIVGQLVHMHDVEPLEDSIIPFAIRDCGVDHTAFLMNRLQNTMRPGSPYIYPSHYYRRILAVQVKTTIQAPYGGALQPNQTHVEVVLKNITHSLTRIEKSDLTEIGGDGPRWVCGTEYAKHADALQEYLDTRLSPSEDESTFIRGCIEKYRSIAESE